MREVSSGQETIVSKTFQFSTKNDTSIYPIVKRVDSVYYRQLDIQFDGSLSFDPNLPRHSNFQKRIVHQWALKTGTQSVQNYTGSVYTVKKDTLTIGSTYTLDYSVSLDGKQATRSFNFKIVDQNS